MENIFVIFEDCEGYIGVAKTYEDAIDFLIEKGYLANAVDFLIYNECLAEALELCHLEGWLEDIETCSLEDLYKIKKWKVNDFNEVFIDQLYISKEKIYSKKG